MQEIDKSADKSSHLHTFLTFIHKSKE